MEFAIWVPLIATIMTAVTGFAAYGWNRRMDRKHALIELRRNLYREFILAMANLSRSGNGLAEVKLYQDKLAELHLVASDEVVSACVAFTALYRSPVDPGAVERARKFAKLEMAMRRDCFEKHGLQPMSWKPTYHSHFNGWLAEF